MKRILSITAILALTLSGCDDQSTGAGETEKPEKTTTSIDIGGGLSISNPRVRVLPGGGPAAGYLRLRNDGTETVRLTAVDSPAFANAMLHRSVEQDGEWSMRPVEGALEIAPGEALVFEPHGLHLMLMQPRATLKPGGGLTITLQFADGAAREVEFDTVGVMEEPR